jgi:hypothetical protein
VNSTSPMGKPTGLSVTDALEQSRPVYEQARTTDLDPTQTFGPNRRSLQRNDRLPLLREAVPPPPLT